MTPAAFRQSLQRAQPGADLPRPLAALWWAANGEWERAHRLVQGEASRDAAWVHAYLHRVEGDAGNARHWYGKAGRPPSSAPLDQEWEAIASALLSAKRTD